MKDDLRFWDLTLEIYPFTTI